MQGKDRPRSHDYEAVNNEDSDDEKQMDEATSSTRKKFEQTEPLSVRLTKLRKRRSSSLSSTPHGLSSFTQLRLHIAMNFKRCYGASKEFVNSYELWRGHFKEIEGSFGNGVLSYFTFLKWLLQLNVYIFILTLCFVIIPQAISTGKELPLNQTPQNASNTTITSSSSSAIVPTTVTASPAVRRRRDVAPNATEEETDRKCHLVKPNDYSLYTNKPFAQLLTDFFSGIGWINTTFMFYGRYSDKVLVLPSGEKTYYNMPLAYFIVGCFCFLVILLSILWSASQIFEESYVKEGSKYSHTYANKVFGGWDMCIEDEAAGKLQTMRIVKEIEVDLAEDLRLATLAQRTKKEIYKLYAIRILVNLIVLGLLGVSAYLIFMASQLSVTTSQDNPDFKASIKTDFIQFLQSYASPITLSALGFIVPSIFFFFSRLEDWNPRVRVNVDLARTVLLKLASIAVLLVSLYNRINETCMLCWENVIGAEMFKLIWTDFFVTILVIVVVQTPRRYFADYVSLGCDLGRKIGRAEFNLPNNVLDLVYGQSLIWIGTWYSPFLPLMAIIKLLITFYAKKATVVYNSSTQEKAYRAGRSNYFFMILLLGTFLLCLAAVAYGVTQIRPSELYGPFRGLNGVYDIIPWTVSILPGGFRDTFRILSSPVFLVVLGVVICLGLYFFYAIAKVYRRMINGLREELSMESRDKKYLLQFFTSQEKP
ncbi:transmembrane channel-like protein 7 [Orbicella faveolata]|uniref:transmembrane channel-like protein 7 n=1 Tax=Orbicella faveolata TaxID=48498 RepID=UPI0009E4A8E5|nr:transmembrane channel-like protein 7 [Orbicella faveolata]